jgi:DNA-binding NarL/FixJ family response regulator
MTIRVFLLDDHEIVRRGLRELLELEADIEVVGESGSAQEATRRIPALRPDVALLDARLPDGSGIDTCRDVRSVDPAISVLIGDWADGGGDPRLGALTPQERRILQHIADGLTNRQIGEAMSLAEKTVKNYVTGILAKLGMQRRTQAAVFAAQHPAPGRRPQQ